MALRGASHRVSSPLVALRTPEGGIASRFLERTPEGIGRQGGVSLARQAPSRPSFISRSTKSFDCAQDRHVEDPRGNLIIEAIAAPRLAFARGGSP
jgi:hypothetical protein